MIIRNYRDLPGEERAIHDGKGTIKSVALFGAEDFQTNLRYISFTRIPPGASIGFHVHENDREEVYVVLSGTGVFTLDSSQERVKAGDVILTKSGRGHGLENDAAESLDVFVFWVEK